MFELLNTKISIDNLNEEEQRNEFKIFKSLFPNIEDNEPPSFEEWKENFSKASLKPSNYIMQRYYASQNPK